MNVFKLPRDPLKIFLDMAAKKLFSYINAIGYYECVSFEYLIIW